MTCRLIFLFFFTDRVHVKTALKVASYFLIAHFVFNSILFFNVFSFDDINKIPPIDLEKHYPALIDLVEKTLQKCPPKDCYIIGVGRSPTPIIALLEILGIPTKSIPYSNSAGIGSLEDRVEFFISSLPTKNELKGKRMALLDFIYSGYTLPNLKNNLEKKININKNNSTTFDLIAFTHSDSSQILMIEGGVFERKGIHNVIVVDNALGVPAFKREGFDAWSEYIESNKNHMTPLKKRKKNPNYIELKKIFMSFIKKDPRIEPRLRKIPGLENFNIEKSCFVNAQSLIY